ncbi:MAG: hypothetical protein IKC19_02115 [Bacteroidales bacterium]|nr:hypothetical protein [Bacteroidales bacterium]
MDFTIEKYNELLDALKHHKDHRIRHDVDLYPERSLRIAKVEAEAGVGATYYSAPCTSILTAILSRP